MTVNKTTVREKKLLEEARDNYRLLKEQYLILQEEHEKLKSGLEKEYYRIENEKRNIASEIEELKEYVSCLISNLETEKLKREQLFEEFKESTLEEIQKLYQEQLKELTDETLHSFENAINAVNETAFNANQENEETLWSKKRRLSQQSAENRLSNPIPLCPDLYANIFFQ